MKKQLSLLPLLFLLSGCTTMMTAGTVMDVTSSEANLACSTDVKIGLVEMAKSCYSAENMTLAVENRGSRDIIGLVINNVTVNKTIPQGGLLVEKIQCNTCNGSLEIMPVIEVNKRIFACSNTFKARIEKC